MGTTDPDLLLVGLDPNDPSTQALATAFEDLPQREGRTLVYLSAPDKANANGGLARGESHAVPKPTRLTELLRLVQRSQNR